MSSEYQDGECGEKHGGSNNVREGRPEHDNVLRDSTWDICGSECAANEDLHTRLQQFGICVCNVSQWRGRKGGVANGHVDGIDTIYAKDHGSLKLGP